MYPTQTAKVCRALQKLANNLDVFQSRVQFVKLAFQHGLVEDITSYEMWERGYEGVGERQFDACFESGDSEDVIAALIEAARAEGFIDTIKQWCGEESFTRWCGYADRQLALF